MRTSEASGQRRRDGEKEKEEGKESVPQRTGHESSQIHSYQQVTLTICARFKQFVFIISIGQHE